MSHRGFNTNQRHIRIVPRCTMLIVNLLAISGKITKQLPNRINNNQNTSLKSHDQCTHDKHIQKPHKPSASQCRNKSSLSQKFTQLNSSLTCNNVQTTRKCKPDGCKVLQFDRVVRTKLCIIDLVLQRNSLSNTNYNPGSIRFQFLT